MGSTTYNHRKGQTFSAAMKRSAEKRQCPNCQRKSAISRNYFGDYFCRWECGYVRSNPAFDQVGESER